MLYIVVCMALETKRSTMMASVAYRRWKDGNPKATDPGVEATLVLWRAVLLCAISDATNFQRNQTENRHRARAYLASNRADFGSFIWICEVIGINHAQAKQALGEKAILPKELMR